MEGEVEDGRSCDIQLSPRKVISRKLYIGIDTAPYLHLALVGF